MLRALSPALTVVLSFILFSAVFSQTSGDYYLDRVVFRIEKSVGDINFMNVDGVQRTNIAKINKLCDQFNIDKIEKFYFWAEQPEDDELVDLSRIIIAYFPPEADLFKVIDALKNTGLVKYAEPYYIHRMDYVPDDPSFGAQWGLSENITRAASAFNLCRGSSDVVIAIVDSGSDMDHSDLVDNFWINLGEDANNDGIIDLWDYNYIDDDGNGYIDDFYGWDFVANDNDPNDDVPMSQGGGHGTHCAGIASAQTDNTNGVSSLGFDCSIMTLRCGAGMTVTSGMAGVGYAIDNGADIISLSWGSYYYSSYEQDVFNSAYQQGIAVFAAAGNDNTQSIHYPSGYDNVVSVASTNSSDQKSGFSNYGTWIDICAPGSSILSTALGGSYVSWDGTSMACPFAAGLAGLIKSANNSLMAEDIINIMYDSADNIYPQNPGYTNLLGHGRINAYNAMLMLLPELTIDSFEMTDYGNGDGRADPNENCDLIFTIENSLNAQLATGTLGELTTEDPSIEITNSSINFGDIIPGFSVNNNTNPFQFSVNPCEPHWTTLILNLSGESFSIDIPIEIEIGRPEILLVDDDQGDELETYYESSFEYLGVFIDMWDQNASDISTEELMKYSIVFWETGNATSTLDEDERNSLQSFLDGGGNLIFSSKSAGADIGETSFYSDYLHADFIVDNIDNCFALTGVDGHPFASGTTLFMVGGSGAGNYQSSDGIAPLGDAVSAYTYDISGDVGGITHDGDYKVVYFGFPMESATGLGGSTSREVLIENILNWIGFSDVKNIEIDYIPETTKLDQNYPNPFNPTTNIRFELPAEGLVNLKVYDITGREVAELVNDIQPAGVYEVTFDGSELASGVYFAVLNAQENTYTQKLLLLK